MKKFYSKNHKWILMLKIGDSSFVANCNIIFYFDDDNARWEDIILGNLTWKNYHWKWGFKRLTTKLSGGTMQKMLGLEFRS